MRLAAISGALVVVLATASLAHGRSTHRPTVGAPGLQQLAVELQTRERALQRREMAIEDKEADLRAIETRLMNRLAELTELRESIDGRLTQLDDAEEATRQDLVRMVQSMRTSEAGAVVAHLEDELAVDVLDRMSATRAGRVLATMPPRRAAQLAERLTAQAEAGP